MKSLHSKRAWHYGLLFELARISQLCIRSRFEQALPVEPNKLRIKEPPNSCPVLIDGVESAS
jgi:hypothetical protein